MRYARQTFFKRVLPWLITHAPAIGKVIFWVAAAVVAGWAWLKSLAHRT